MSELIKNLEWRYATKVFDKSKKISDKDMDEIVESFRLTASSFWLEPWKLIIVENNETREKLKSHSWNQSQITDASHLLVLARVNEIDDKYIDTFLDNNVTLTWATREDLSWYEKMMKWYFWNLDENQKASWARDQVFIALWNLMSFLANKHIDSCAIWWFDPKMYDEVLDLKSNWLSSVVVLPIGYRSEEDKYANKPKVRFSKDDILLKIV